MSIDRKENGKRSEILVYKSRFLSHFTHSPYVDGFSVAGTGKPFIVTERSIRDLGLEDECTIDYFFINEGRKHSTRIYINSNSPYVVLQMINKLPNATTLLGEVGYDSVSGTVGYANIVHTRDTNGDLVMSAAQWDFEKNKLRLFNSIDRYDTGKVSIQKNELTSGQPSYVGQFMFNFENKEQDIIAVTAEVLQRSRILHFPTTLWEAPLHDAFTGYQWARSIDFIEKNTSLEYKIT